MVGFGEKIGVFALLLTSLGVFVSPYPLALIFSYVLHELGHLAFAKMARAELSSFRLGSFRLCISYSTKNLTYKREILVQIGGVIFNLFLAVIIYLIPILSGGVWDFLVGCNLSLALMNLYPVSVLDGGGIVCSLLHMCLSKDMADKMVKLISFIFTIILWLVAVYLQIVFFANISLLIISVFLLIELCLSSNFAHG